MIKDYNENNDFVFESEDNEETSSKDTGIYLPVEAINFLFLLDTSGSMYGERINQLNNAMPLAFNAIKKAAALKEVDALIRIIEYNNEAHWRIGTVKEGVTPDEAVSQWQPMNASGGTATDKAIELARTALRTKYLGTRNYNPVIIHVTDGSSDNPDKTLAAIEKLKVAMCDPNGETVKKDKVWRIAIGVKDYNEAELNAFAMTGRVENELGDGEDDVPMVFKVDDVNQLASVLKNVAECSLYSSFGAGCDGESGMVMTN